MIKGRGGGAQPPTTPSGTSSAGRPSSKLPPPMVPHGTQPPYCTTPSRLDAVVVVYAHCFASRAVIATLLSLAQRGRAWHSGAAL